MLNFKPIRLEDKDWMQPMLRESGYIGSEAAFGTLYLWGEILHLRACVHKENLLLSLGEKSNRYYFPAGRGDLRESLEALVAHSRERQLPFRMWGLTNEQIALVEQAWPGVFVFKLDRAGSDYIYSAQDLITLGGRKLHRKRNHLKRFRNTYTYTYEDITPANLPDCMAIALEWQLENPPEGGSHRHRERCALWRGFDSYAKLGFLGGMIRIDGEPAAFTIGEEINNEVFLIHFEKALNDYQGLYTAINQEFAARNLEKYRYINREEDMGIEGLRKAKLSYYPEFILEKHIAFLREEARHD
jgi:hypothetical protein